MTPDDRELFARAIPVLLAAWEKRITMTKNHRYRVDGDWQPSVTTIINALDKPALNIWRMRVQREADIRTAFNLTRGEAQLLASSQEEFRAGFMELAGIQYEADRLADEAAQVGKQVHSLIEYEIRTRLGQAPPAPEGISDEAHWLFDGWDDWAKAEGFTPVAAEGRVCSLRYGYAGTFDVIAFIRDELRVGDWKTSPLVYPEYVLQNVAYRRAAQEMGMPEMGGFLLQLPKDGTGLRTELLDKYPPDPAFKAFLAARLAYRWLGGFR